MPEGEYDPFNFDVFGENLHNMTPEDEGLSNSFKNSYEFLQKMVSLNSLHSKLFNLQNYQFFVD